MVSIVRLNRVDLIDDKVDFEALKRAPRCFMVGGSPAVSDELERRGVIVSPLPPEGTPDGSLVLVYEGPLYDLVRVSDRLLGPGGCPWDQAQTHESLKRYLLEEAYEVLDAIDSGSDEKLQEELGDLMLQPVMHAEMKKLAGRFDIDEVATTVVDKLIRRHPHVFDALSVEDADEVLRNWDRIKKSEKSGEAPASILAGVPKGMASLLRAYEISKRAQRAGFEWPDLESVFVKLEEEKAELLEVIASGDHEEIESEIGDLLFTTVNIARWCKVEPEEALRKMLNRFTERFQAMEAGAEKPLEELSLDEWDELWVSAKGEG